jgi:Mce-associated membrane protein
MSRPTPRRPASSRGAVNRPRKIAGRTVTPATAQETPTAVGADDVDGLDDEIVEIVPPGARASDDEPEPATDQEPVLASPRVTRMLLTILTVLTVLLVLQGGWWVQHGLRDAPKASEASGAIAVPVDRPVLQNELAWKEGVDVAARAVKAMSSRSFESYDADVDAATALLTDSFAEEFRKTAGDVEEEFLAKEAVMSAEIRSQSVVRANDAELQALIMFDQVTRTAAGDDPKTVHSDFRALVTMVHTDQGWFVDRLDAG